MIVIPITNEQRARAKELYFFDKLNGSFTEGEGNKEMLDTMETISALLVQLNSTMQGPLIVTSTNKKFQ